MSGPHGAAPQPLVIREDRNGAAVLLLNRPDQRNALRYESWSELSAALTAVISSVDTAGVVIAGSNGFFSSGGDLKTGPAHGHSAVAPAARVEHAQRVMEFLRSVPVPTVAAVEGAAVGLGWSLALSCDLVVAADDAFFSAPFVARAVVPDGGLAWRLTQQLGRHRAAAVLLRGTKVSAREAYSAGLVTDLVPPGHAIDTAVDIVCELAAADAGAVELTKRLIGSVEAAALAAFHPLELATAVVAQQRSAAGAGRSSFA
ncbi:enoyl-CoA hydratase/isomerase family protein [Mycolicibacterium sp. 018/SC-01/001]|uniref:enoyl-CoA hydratase/isomerase family protein n=1 Tax=Mycolicibacterium sp. 018/SC-01/001 TaxID=2592069 RepID=UPI00117DFC50|nr:enoyl-CoA hydratase/isomerase family protein [Mycolicibacterium sp. 018/SC-01/001]TRW79623.1 enoyl-CoA hydratase/isomerase family protein [Mycolicibacterium sp. 018/SC-01/001]